MAKTCKFYKLKQEVSFDCGETWEATGQYDKGRLYEINSRDCGFMLIYRWALSQGDYDCDGVRKYNMEVLQFTTEQGGEYQNVSPEYKRRAGNVVEWLSEDCGYVESTGGFKFSGTSEISCGHTGRTGEGNPSVLYRSEVSGITAPHSIVGDCTEVIGEYAFSGTNIQTVDISSYTTEIEDYAFAGCSGLTSMTIPDTVEKVGAGLFSKCINLTGATLPSGLDYIPTLTFDTTAVENYVVPNGIKLIGNESFVGGNGWWYGSGRTQDLNITFTTGVTDIGEMAFAGRDFNGTLTLPSSLKYIGREAFRCSLIDGDLALPNGVEHIGENIFIQDHGEDIGIGSGITVPGSIKLLRSGGSDSRVKEVIIGEGVEAIEGLPVGCDISNIPNSTNILLACGGVGHVPFDTGCTNGCDGIQIIPENVNIVGSKSSSFNGGYHIVVYESLIPPITLSYADCSSSTSTIDIVVPDESLELYKAMWNNARGFHPRSHLVYDWMPLDINTYWECVGMDKHYQEQLRVSVDSGETWQYTSAMRTGELYEPNSTDCGYIPLEYTSVVTYNDGKCNSVTRCDTSTAVPSYCGDTTVSTITIGKCATSVSGSFQECTNATDLTILSGITAIGDYAFQSCTNLTSITIADSVTTIDDYAFAYCSNFTNVGIPSSVTSIGYNTFKNCYKLTSIDIPDSVTSIGGYAFNGCRSLTSCTIGSGVTSIGSYAFSGCTGLTSIVIPSGVTSIYESTFSNCRGLTSVTLSDNVAYIGTSAFTYCNSLTSISLPDSVRQIGYNAFQRCSSLTSIDIPSGVTSIGGYAFDNCYSLTGITINAVTPPTLDNANAFNNTNNCPIYVPCESKQAYKTASYHWTSLSSRIVGIPPCYVPPSFIARYSDSTEYTVDCETSRYVTSATTKPTGYQQSAMTEAIIGDCVTSIGDWSFLGCSNMTACTIGSGVTSIGQYAFYNCSSLVGVTINASAPPNLGNYAFNGTNYCPIYVPRDSVSSYKSYWSYYSSRIQAIPT